MHGLRCLHGAAAQHGTDDVVDVFHTTTSASTCCNVIIRVSIHRQQRKRCVKTMVVICLSCSSLVVVKGC